MKKIKIPEEINKISFSERIKILAELAHQADPENLVFGSEKHKYQFNQTLNMEVIRNFEKRTGIILPDDYKEFLTKVGNGGAGIDYGLYSIEQIEQNFSTEVASDGMTLFDYNDPVEKYLQISSKMEELEEQYNVNADEQYKKLNADLIRGMLIIGTAGCTYDYFIMCKGVKKGYVGMLDWNMIAEKEGAPIIFDKTFSEWLEDYFRRIILGKTVWHRCFYSIDYNAEI